MPSDPEPAPREDPGTGAPAAPPARPDGDPMVIVDGLHVTYRVLGAEDEPGRVRRILRHGRPRPREIHALRGVSFVLRRGEAVGVVGSNGSGKSTLLRSIAGLLPGDRGDVFTCGQPVLLGVNAALMDDLTGERNIVLGCLAMGMPLSEVRAKYDDVVEFSGLGKFIDMPMRTYSTGMAQRLRFAIATAQTSEILMIDEALATGDARFRRRSEDRLKELREEAATVVLVSHSLETIEETCDRTIWLDHGRVRLDGPSADVVAAYRDEHE
ncbi:ABC transporter ATP-binding protein [Actinomadura violacea]|uniref:ABC transporter ATP-binding protein n=1 Tax=Actinomadura violacea TaxID=2819934 RepID=A0ABS3RIR2_9ACTN|nr:ABC transporter ATP-binding protein [Actinomadura violacea]MBO2456233.1 ABC transporter ATP-binding protein [Actinomadura violacea]